MRKASSPRCHTLGEKGPMGRQPCPDGQEQGRGEHHERSRISWDCCSWRRTVPPFFLWNKQWLTRTQQQSGESQGWPDIIPVPSHIHLERERTPPFPFPPLSCTSLQIGFVSLFRCPILSVPWIGRTEIKALHPVGTAFSKGLDVSRR